MDAVAPSQGQTGSELAQFATRALAQVDTLADQLVDELRGHDRAYGGPLVERDDLWRSCHDNLVRVIGHLAGIAPLGGASFQPSRETGRRRAEQGFPLENLLHAYRVGGRIIWEALLDEARRDGPRAIERLAESAGQVWDVVDAYSAVVAESYRSRETDLRRHDDEQRLAHLDGLLDGRGQDPRFAREAAAVLDLPEGAEFTVVVIHPRTMTSPAPPPAIELPAVWRFRGDGQVGIIALDRRGTEHVRSRLTGDVTGHAGFSPAVPIGDLDRALRWATLAAMCAGDGEVVALDDRLPDAILASEPDLSARLVERIHEPLDAVDDEERALLLETVDVYLASSLSVAQASRTLYCHRNTVRNRLGRFESLTERRIDDVGDLVEIALARRARRSQEERLQHGAEAAAVGT